ncbi:MAG: DUF4932 domain-containing protein [Firmicutes bacterium]|nr:DUF4932 domain-containing protein [Bacillota bacterium]
MSHRSILVISLLIVFAFGVHVRAEFRVSPEMELLAGVLAQTTWIETRGPSGSGNEYFQALQQFFRDYQGHPAVNIAQDLTKRGFTYDAPPAFVCHLGPLPDLELTYEYSQYLVNRAGGRDKLEEFRIALADLAAESDFLSFFEGWLPYLEASLEHSHEGFSRTELEAWLENFFGWAPAEFQLIMAPSMFPGGGYGATVTNAQGQVIAAQIIREQGTSQGKPEFPTGDDLASLTLHEMGHTFVNPSLEAYPERAKRLAPLFWPVRKIMRDQAYPTVQVFLNEQVLRGMEVVAARDLFTPEMETISLDYNERRGFYLTGFIAEQLSYYQVNRDLYPTFKEFVPYLYDQLELYQRENRTWLDRFCGRLYGVVCDIFFR